MDMARHLEILRTEGDRLGSLPADALGARVPSMDDWTVERVVRHTGKVHQWTRAVLALPDGASLADTGAQPGLPKGPDCLPAYRDEVQGLADDLARQPPERALPTFGGLGDVAWWARRQALEVQVHRTDAQDAVHAAGGPAPDPMAVDGAADGIDEWARFFLATRWAQRFGTLPDDLHGRTIHVHGTDDPAPADGAEWLLAFGPEGVSVDATHAKGDVALRGSCQDLLLVLWRRRPLAALDVVGDATVAERVLDLARF